MDKGQGSIVEFSDYGLGLVAGNTDDRKVFSLVVATVRDLDPQKVWQAQLSGYLMELHSRNMLADDASIRLALDFIVQADRARLDLHAVLVKAKGRLEAEIMPLAIATRAIATKGCSKEAALKDAASVMNEVKFADPRTGPKQIRIASKSKIEALWTDYKSVLHYLDAMFLQSKGTPVADPIKYSEDMLQKLRQADQPLANAITIVTK